MRENEKKKDRGFFLREYKRGFLSPIWAEDGKRRKKRASFFSLKGSKRETKDPTATVFFFKQKSKIKQGVSMIIYF